MPELVKFPSIEQFRNVIKYVKHRSRYSGRDADDQPIYNQDPLPTLSFLGTVKLHGTNAAICQTTGGERWFQSRERILTPEDDNYGFAAWCAYYHVPIDCMFNRILNKYHDVRDCYVYGEWCGQGIQAGVAISSLPKMFVVFAVKIVRGDGTQYWIHDIDSQLNAIVETPVRSIYDFKIFRIDIDFNCPELHQNALIKFTEEVEAQCPVGFKLKASGVGEGIVWHCTTPEWNTSETWFKVKGEKHSVTKVRTLAAVDIERATSIKECAEKITAEARLKQGLSYLKEMKLEADVKNMGVFLKWLASDAIKEEADTIAASGLEPKDVGKEISNIGRKWFLKNI